MKVVIAGGSGFIGGSVIPMLVAARHEVIVLTRDLRARRRDDHRVRFVGWDGATVGPWASELEGCGCVINLAGALIAGKRWTRARKKVITESRLLATGALVDAANRLASPAVLISASGVGYYGNVESGEVTESHPAGHDYVANLCRLWEGQALRAAEQGTRVVILRLGLVLSLAGGALPRLALPFRVFAGGYLGTGRQWFPWVHVDDVSGAILHALDNAVLSGPVNVAAPESVTMKEFCRMLGRAMGRPSWTRAPAFVLRAALGEMADVLLTGQRVVPRRLLESGYRFRHPSLAKALEAIISNP